MYRLTYNDKKELAGITYTDPWDADLIKGVIILFLEFYI